MYTARVCNDLCSAVSLYCKTSHMFVCFCLACPSQAIHLKRRSCRDVALRISGGTELHLIAARYNRECSLHDETHRNTFLSLVFLLIVNPMLQKSDKPHAQSSGFSFVIHEVHSESKSSFRVFSQRGKCNSNESVSILLFTEKCLTSCWQDN